MDKDPPLADYVSTAKDMPSMSVLNSLLENVHPSIARDYTPWLVKRVGRPSEEACELILIRNGTAVRYLGTKELPESLYNKARAFDAQVRWVVQRLPPAPGQALSMCVHLGSTPVHRLSDDRAFPTYSLAKTYKHLDIVYPNMYFGYGGSLDDWAEFQGELVREAAEHPYPTRQSRAFWRGTCGGYRYNRGRIHLVLASSNNTKLDVGFSNECPSSGGNDEDAEVLKAVNRIPLTKFIRPRAMVEYKYLFSMPGSSKGSYSRHLQTALCSNATVLLWDNEYYEFYYSLLQPWVHYVPVSEATLEERMAWLGEHVKDAEAIAAAGYHFCMTQLTAPAITTYWLQLFTVHGLLQAYDVEHKVIVDACTCQDVEAVERCEFCK